MNFAIVGCGIIAHSHAGAIAKIEDCTLYAVCDIIADKADAFAKEHGAQKVYYDHRELVGDPAVDVVCVCVPSGIHAEITIDAARAGKAVVCEKPMEITPDKMRSIVAAAKETGVKIQCIFQRRLMPVAIAVRKLIAEGGLGKIYFAEASLLYYRDQAYYDSAGWRGTWELDGGGALMNQGVHGVDLILWLMGDKVDSLYGSALTLGRRIEVEDTAAAILHMHSGALCVIKGTTTSYPGFSTTMSLYGEKGSVSFNDEGVLTWEFVDPQSAPPQPDPMGAESVGGSRDPSQISNYGHICLLEDLANAIREERAPMIPPEDAMAAVEVICAIYESTRKHGEVTF